MFDVELGCNFNDQLANELRLVLLIKENTCLVGGQLTILRLHGSWNNLLSDKGFCFSCLVLKISECLSFYLLLRTLYCLFPSCMEIGGETLFLGNNHFDASIKCFLEKQAK